VRADGTVKVTDFGIAKMLGQTRLTSTGQTMGTVRYMSPEQVRGKVADARSDLYSLGITLYESLAGGTPFDGENHFDIMQQHLKNRPPPLARKNPAVPPSVEKVLMTALEKNAQDRFADATEFRVALERVLPDVSSAPALGVPRRKRSRLAPALGLVVLLVGGIGATLLIARSLTHHAPSTGAASDGTKPATKPAAKASEPLWPPPATLTNLAVAADHTFDADGLRVQSTSKRDLQLVRDGYVSLLPTLRQFFSESRRAALADAAKSWTPRPLNLVIVPQAMLDDPSLWPGYPTSPDSTYPSRYVPGKRTLFVNDTQGFITRDLPFGVALHLLSTLPSLTDVDCVRLAENFEDYYKSKHPR
jgi:serine/threonine protein kinase